MSHSSPAAAALRASLPVLFGYVPLGIAFGLLFDSLGHPWYFATLMGLLVFAGAAQFLAVGLLAAHAGLLEVAITTFLLNSRHLFFGLSLLTRFRVGGWRKLYLVFGLTDETYSLLTGTRPPDGVPRVSYDLWVTGLNQLWWVSGCTLGALLGQAVAFDTTGLDFTLTALFAVLVLEQSVYCCTLGGTFSESLTGQMQGAFSQEWQVPFKRAQRRKWPASGSPEGNPPRTPMLRCSPCQGRAITCGLRLALAFLGGSESADKRATVH